MKKNRDTIRGEKQKKNGKGFRPVECIVLAIAAIVFLVSAFQLGKIFLEDKAGTDEYGDLGASYVLKGEEFGVPVKGTQPTETEQETGVDPGFPDMQVNYSALSELNRDFLGWLYVPALEVEYPVVQGEDNDYYISHTFEKKGNRAGAIFMDCGANPDLSDYNTIIYGHNMRNRSMFGKLKLFIQEEELCRNNPYFYLYTPQKTYRYLIISYYVTKEGTQTYTIPGTQEQYEAYRAHILRSTPYRSEIEIPETGNLVTLSTCYGKAGSDQRFVVHGILDAVRENGQ